jgi:hypothetical protein
VAPHAFDVRYESHAAAVVLELRIVQAVLFGKSVYKFDRHEFT